MNEKTLRVLEYDKIIGKLCEECCSVLTRDEARALKPMTDARLIRDELSATDEAVTVLLKKGAPPLGNFYDISGLVHLAAKDGSLTPKQLLEVGYNLHSARRTAEYLSSDLPELVTIDGLASAISVLKGLENEIERCIISEDEIADSASSELARIRRAILRQNEAIRSKINQIVNSSDNQAFLQDAIVTMRQGRYVIPVKAEHIRVLPLYGYRCGIRFPQQQHRSIHHSLGGLQRIHRDSSRGLEGRDHRGDSGCDQTYDNST